VFFNALYTVFVFSHAAILIKGCCYILLGPAEKQKFPSREGILRLVDIKSLPENRDSIYYKLKTILLFIMAELDC